MRHIIFILFLFLPLFSWSQQKDLDSLFLKLDSCIARKDYDSAKYLIHIIKNETQSTNKKKYLKSIIKHIDILHLEHENDSVNYVLKTEIHNFEIVEQSILNYLAAWHSLKMYNYYRYESDSISDNMQYKLVNNLYFYYKESLKFPSALLATKSSEYQDVLRLIENKQNNITYEKDFYLEETSFSLYP